MFDARLDVLPEPQRRLWRDLQDTPATFVLYGGTALALRLGHRQSLDFDFFSTAPFAPSDLLRDIPYLSDAQLVQSSPNTLTCRVDRGGDILVSFFGGLTISYVQPPEVAVGTTLRVASLLDLAATKVKVVLDRASYKDYVDIDALLQAGIALPHALAAAGIVYGPSFDPILSLKALSYFGDGDVPQLPRVVKNRLLAAVRAVDLALIPAIQQGLERPSGGEDHDASC